MPKFMPDYTFDISYIKKENSLNLFAWHEVENFGDKLGPALFHLLSKRSTYIESRGLNLTFEFGEPRIIYCFLGTLAQLVCGSHHFIFWGFGSTPISGPKHHGSQPIKKGLDIDFRALRGPLTRYVIAKSGYKIPRKIPYGDPGLLVPYFYKRSSKIVGNFCIIPHHILYNTWSQMYPEYPVLDIRIKNYSDIQNLIYEMTQYKMIFTSSLHVTILAESFGIPVIPLEPRLPFKFNDFYASCNKKIKYIKTAKPDLDFEKISNNFIAKWKPIIWDPLPFLNSAPFAINKNIINVLSRHYKSLQNYKPEKSDNVIKHGGLLQKKLSKQKVKKKFVVVMDTAKDGFSSWMENNHPEKPVISQNNKGYSVEIADNTCYLATPFFITGENMKEITININITTSMSIIEIRLQDTKYNTWKSLLIKDDPGNLTFNFYPVEKNMQMRIVFMPLRGIMTINRLQVITST